MAVGELPCCQSHPPLRVLGVVQTARFQGPRRGSIASGRPRRPSGAEGGRPRVAADAGEGPPPPPKKRAFCKSRAGRSPTACGGRQTPLRPPPLLPCHPALNQARLRSPQTLVLPGFVDSRPGTGTKITRGHTRIGGIQFPLLGSPGGMSRMAFGRATAPNPSRPCGGRLGAPENGQTAHLAGRRQPPHVGRNWPGPEPPSIARGRRAKWIPHTRISRQVWPAGRAIGVQLPQGEEPCPTASRSWRLS
jgi:hypothetical protein